MNNGDMLQAFEDVFGDLLPMVPSAPQFSIYCAGPISGQGYDEVVGYYKKIVGKLSKMGFDVLYPMCGKSYLRNEIEFKAEGYEHPLSTNHAILRRDRWMIEKADVIYVNLVRGAERVSIGTVAEMGMAHALGGKHVVTVLPDDNIHNHSFVLEMSDVVFKTEDEAEEYLGKLAGGTV